jgi:flagellar protein FliJ
MKKFKFRLQRVLEYRNVLKKEKERELALRNAELHEAQERLERIVAAQDSTAVPDRPEMSMAELMLTGEYLRYLQDALVNQRLLVHQAAEAVEAARDAYIEKAIEAESLEGVKDRRFSEFKEESGRQERREMDKLTVQRYRFKSKLVGKREESGGTNG